MDSSIKNSSIKKDIKEAYKGLKNMLKYDDLKEKIYSLFNQKEVSEDNETISLYTLKEILKREFKEYNDVLIKDKNKYIKKYNRKNSLFNRHPYISDIIPGINECGEAYLQVFLEDEFNNKAGRIYFFSDYYNPNLELLDLNKCSVLDFINILKSNESKFKMYLNVLNEFKDKYKGYEFIFDSKNPSSNAIQVIDNGFIKCTINLNDINSTRATLSNMEELQISLMRTGDDGVLYDYIEFYNDEIMRKTSVNINDLNPLIKEIVEKNLGLDKQNKLEL